MLLMLKLVGLITNDGMRAQTEPVARFDKIHLSLRKQIFVSFGPLSPWLQLETYQPRNKWMRQIPRMKNHAVFTDIFTIL